MLFPNGAFLNIAITLEAEMLCDRVAFSPLSRHGYELSFLEFFRFNLFDADMQNSVLSRSARVDLRNRFYKYSRENNLYGGIARAVQNSVTGSFTDEAGRS